MTKLYKLFTLILLICLCTADSSDVPCPRAIDIACAPQGPIRGYIDKSVTGQRFRLFKGIPVAKPPINERRFELLEPLDPWTEVYNATQHYPICMQPRGEISLMTNPRMSEDCIAVNIYTPIDANENSSYSVFIYIPENNFVLGSGDTDIYGPQLIVPSGVILVTFNFRLGALGFLSLGKVLPGNLGLKDVVYHLKWINKNIKAFGGNPNDVTIGGHGYGAAIANLLQFTPLVDSTLVNKFVFIGGNAYQHVVSKLPERASDVANQLAEILCLNASDPNEFLEELKKLDAETLTNASNQVYFNEFSYLHGFGTVIEEDCGDGQGFLLEHPLSYLKKGKFLDLPTAIGFAFNDGTFYAKRALKYQVMERLCEDPSRFLPILIRYSDLEDEIKDQLIEKIIDRYFGDEELSDKVLRNWVDYINDHDYKYPTLLIADYARNLQSKIYVAEFQYLGNYNLMSREVGGLFPDVPGHADDVNYIFVPESQKPIMPCSDDAKFSGNITSLWLNFIKFGNPTPDGFGLPLWKPVEGDKIYIYQVNETFSNVESPYGDIFDFFQDIHKYATLDGIPITDYLECED